MKSKLIDDTCIALSKLVVITKEVGLYALEAPEVGNKAVNEFFKYGIEMITKGLQPIVLEIELSSIISQYVLDNTIDKETLMALEIIKGLLEPVRHGEYRKILNYVKYKASYKVYRDINDNVLQKYVRENL